MPIINWVLLKKKFHNQKSPVKRHKSRFYIPSKLRRHLSKRKHSEIQPRLPSFQRELQKLCWRTLTYYNICMDQDLRIDVEVFLTLKHLDPHMHQHIRKESIFPIGQKKNGTARVQFETATATFFNQWKIICS